ncbi:MAG: hypothetical protein Fur0028_00720 [Bacteroidales bacterium]
MKEKKVILFFYPLIEKNEIFTNIPWAYLYLERMIRELEVEFILIDERLEQNLYEKITFYKDNILFCAVSVMIGHQITGAVSFTKLFRSISDKPVLWGGWFPTILPEMILKDGYADYICQGQGEIPFKNFVEKLLANEDLTKIKGIGTKKGDNIILNENKDFINPETFPKINFNLIDINKFIDIKEIVPIEKRSVDYLATSGCPYKCKFCNAVHIFNRKWFPKKVEQIINDLKYLKEKTNISHVDFRDDNFFGNKKFILDFSKQLIDSKINITWEANVHLGFLIRNFNDQDMKLIYKSGCRLLRIGAESGDQEVLDFINKGITVKEIYSAVRFLKKHKIKTRFLTMSCFPLNPQKDFWNTAKLIGNSILINPELDIRFRFFVPIPESELWEISVQKGFKLPTTTEEMMRFFTNCFTYHYITPWNNTDYLKYLNNFNNFYFLWTNPGFYKKFPMKWKPVALLLTLFLYPLIFLRFKCSLLKCHVEAILFIGFTSHARR